MRQITGAIALSLLVLQLTAAASESLQTRRTQGSWPRYINSRWDFCVNYPSSWHKNEGLNGGGVMVYPKEQCELDLESNIAIGGSPGQLSESPDESRLPTLEEHFAYSVEALKKWAHATNIEVVSKTSRVLEGHPALLTMIRYVDAQRGKSWIREEETIEYPKGAFFSVALQCHPDERPAFQPIFDRIVASVKLQCN